MPIAKYDRFFGGKKGSAGKAKRAMAKQYGTKKGEEIFYATKNKWKAGNKGRKRSGDRVGIA